MDRPNTIHYLIQQDLANIKEIVHEHTSNATRLQLPVNQDNAPGSSNMSIAVQCLLGHPVEHWPPLYACDAACTQLC